MRVIIPRSVSGSLLRPAIVRGTPEGEEAPYAFVVRERTYFAGYLLGGGFRLENLNGSKTRVRVTMYDFGSDSSFSPASRGDTNSQVDEGS